MTMVFLKSLNGISIEMKLKFSDFTFVKTRRCGQCVFALDEADVVFYFGPDSFLREIFLVEKSKELKNWILTNAKSNFPATKFF